MGSHYSISSSRGFKSILNKPDLRVSTKNLSLFARKNSANALRVGVSIKKKDFKLATTRNKIKRKIKGSFISKRLELPKMDFVVLVKKKFNMPSDQGSAEILELIRGIK